MVMEILPFSGMGQSLYEGGESFIRSGSCGADRQNIYDFRLENV